MSDAAAQTVLSFYSFPPGMVRRIESLGNAGGWSGSQIWKVEIAASAVGNALRGVPGTADSPEYLCLRRWPREHPTPERLRLIHHVLERVSQGGLHVVPTPLRTTQGATFAEQDGHLWELTLWMPGTADFHARPARERLRAAMQTLAQFHLIAHEQQLSEVRPAPALVERLEQIPKYVRQNGDLIAAIHRGLEPSLDDLGRRIFFRAGGLLLPLVHGLKPACQLALPLQPAIRDIWHDHVLFTGDAVSGIVDFGSLRIDTPLADIARLVGSLVGDDQESRTFAFEAYAELRPLSATELELIDLLDDSGLVLSGLNWLTWLYLERRDMGPLAPIATRLSEIYKRLQKRPRRIFT